MEYAFISGLAFAVLTLASGSAILFAALRTADKANAAARGHIEAIADVWRTYATIGPLPSAVSNAIATASLWLDEAEAI